MSGIQTGRGKGWFVALCALALLMQVLVPRGFMMSGQAGAPALVICTGHGPMVVQDQHHPAKAPKPGADAPCAFSAHGAAGPPPLQRLAPSLVAFTLVEQPAKPAFDLAPGRGLAAPPPPSHAPPATPI